MNAACCFQPADPMLLSARSSHEHSNLTIVFDAVLLTYAVLLTHTIRLVYAVLLT